MEDLKPCSIGELLHETCHKITYTKKLGTINVNDLSTEDWELLIWRTGISQVAMTAVCQHHYEGYITKYEKYHHFVCCDPLHQHSSKSVKNQLRTVNIDLARDIHSLLNISVIPGQKLCCNCCKTINESLNSKRECVVNISNSPSGTKKDSSDDTDDQTS